MIAQSPLGAMQQEGAAEEIGMGDAMMEMMNGLPLRTLLAFSGGALPVDAINGLLAQLNA